MTTLSDRSVLSQVASNQALCSPQQLHQCSTSLVTHTELHICSSETYEWRHGDYVYVLRIIQCFVLFITCFYLSLSSFKALPFPSSLFPAVRDFCSASRPFHLYTSFITINISHCSQHKYVYYCHSLIGHLFNVFSLSLLSLSAPLFIVRSECIVRKSNTYLMIMDWCASEWRKIGTEQRAGKSDPNISKVQT